MWSLHVHGSSPWKAFLLVHSIWKWTNPKKKVVTDATVVWKLPHTEKVVGSNLSHPLSLFPYSRVGANYDELKASQYSGG